ncbi:MAG: hypothetical protein AAF750_07065 [Planctomycetota bacterium]
MELPEKVREMLAIAKIRRIAFRRVHLDPTSCKAVLVLVALCCFLFIIYLQVLTILSGPFEGPGIYVSPSFGESTGTDTD